MRVKQQARGGVYNNKAALIVGTLVLAMGIVMVWTFRGPSQPVSPTVSLSTVIKDANMPSVSVCVFNEQGQLVGPFVQPKVIKTEEEWKAQLTKEQYYVTRNSGTERAFCGNLLDNKKEGVYTCVCCRLPLFSSDAKFNSGTGWPSFFQPICKENVAEKSDASHGMVRVEINCARCDAHLGHVFDDGPQPTNLRFCLNSESLDFTEKSNLAKLAEKGK
ncbi:MAG: peptide-methionine (R)-S-oxide reductase MsrB [Gemmatales bacterium]